MAPENQVVCEYLVPEQDKYFDLQTGLRAVLGSQYILVVSEKPRMTISSAVAGGGLGLKRHFINRQVSKDYCVEHPAEEIAGFLATSFSDYNKETVADWTTLMTSAQLKDACWIRLSQSGLQVTVIVSAGVNNACAAGITPYCVLDLPALTPGTINIMAFLSQALTPGAMVNAVQTVTEAKTQTLRELNVKCPVTGTFASGTNSDAVVIAADGPLPYPYAGPGTLMGYLLALGVRKALSHAVKKYLLQIHAGDGP